MDSNKNTKIAFSNISTVAVKNVSASPSTSTKLICTYLLLLVDGTFDGALRTSAILQRFEFDFRITVMPFIYIVFVCAPF